MSQNPTSIIDSNGATFLVNLNLASDTLRTNGSGPSAPSSPLAGWPWMDMTNNLFKIRDAANLTWKTVLDDQGIHAASTVTVPQLSDQIPILDSTSSFALKNTTLNNLRESIQTLNNRNRFINGAFSISQINGSSAVTVVAGSALNYVIDQWYAYCTGANVTGQRIAGSGQSQYRYQLTGAAGVTKIGFAQRMEAANTYDMNSKTTIIGVDISNSLLTSVTWTAWYANTTDTFGTLASPTRTQIGTGTITVSSTLNRYFIPVTIPSSATTGIEIEFSVGAQTSGTWVIGNAQFEKVPTGAVQGTDFEVLPYDTRCLAFFEQILVSARAYATAAGQITDTDVSWHIKRTLPIITISDGGGRSNLSTSPTLSPYLTKSGGRFEITSAAVGDYRALGDLVTLDSRL